MNVAAGSALRACEALGAVGVVLSSLEFIAKPEIINDSSLMSWPVFRLRHHWYAMGAAGVVLDGVLTFPRVLWILRARLLSAVAILALPLHGLAHVVLLAIIVVSSAAMMLRTTYGLEGSDQLLGILFMTLLLVAIHPSATAMRMGLWFLALQACLAYFTSGIYKVTSRIWWDGAALIGILGTRSYGNERLALWFGEHLGLTKWSSRAFVLSETAFPLVLACPPGWLPWFLAWGIGFHVTCAVIMGLDGFVWAFLATYPAIVFCNLQ